ncbi:MAG: tRNA (adenosine(37)-N6)-dimethylallyltransferase MiaA [Clostridia bacterium]|nr:tRNA (adenosine(37)-N6)-dimethylallyltransferase MiaA [Clostridia bacterium]
MSKIPVVVIAGPTGVGKTAASIELAKRTEGEIISADSMQIYRGMDIGTAKVTPDEMQGVPHHLIDIADPKENYSVYRFVSDCKKVAESILSRGKLPIIVGGTGLYIDSFLSDIDFTEVRSDENYRRKLESLAEEKGNEYVHDMLKAADPASAESIHPNNLKRVIRALEYYKTTNTTISSHNEETKKKASPYSCCYICLTRDRDELYERIDKRVDIMLEKGLIDEVKKLLEAGCTREHTSMQALGYKEIIDYLEGTVSFDEAVETLKRDSRRYAKRQLTWFRRRDDALWINLTDTPNPVDICAEYIRTKLKR